VQRRPEDSPARSAAAPGPSSSPRRPRSHFYPSNHCDLAPAAKRLLTAARVLVDRLGLRGLTNEAVAAEAGERKSLIHYYFGGKPGLLVALADWLFYDYLWELRTRVTSLPGGEARVHGVVQHIAHLSADRLDYLSYYELLPLLLRDEPTRKRLGEYLSEEAAVVGRALTFDDEQATSEDPESLGRLLMAVGDGYAIQLLAGSPSLDLDVDMRLLETMLDCCLLKTQPPAGDAGRSVGDAAG
jgi:AcrR family transcriptional regulator